MGHLSFVPLPVLLGHSNLMKTMTVHVTNKTTIFKMKLKILMLLSIILAFRRETSLQCAKRTAGYCFAFFMKLHENGSSHFLKKKAIIFQLSDALRNQQQQIQAGNFVLSFLYWILFCLKKSHFLHSHSFSLGTNTVCMWGREMSWYGWQDVIIYLTPKWKIMLCKECGKVTSPCIRAHQVAHQS